MSSKQNRYIETRMEQLKEDMSKAHDEHDKKWYNRCIQELDWVLQMSGKPTRNCHMSKKVLADWSTLPDLNLELDNGKNVSK